MMASFRLSLLNTTRRGCGLKSLLNDRNPSLNAFKFIQSCQMTTSPPSQANEVVRAITYRQNGDPNQVLRLQTYPSRPPGENQLKLRFMLSPLNPADINTIQGRYPWKPNLRTDLVPDKSFYIAGNEGVAEVIELGSHVDQTEWSIGDWVVMGKPQLGTWQSLTNLSVNEVIKLPRSTSLTETQAATMSVNMSTAYRLLKEYFPFPSPTGSPSDRWIIQNGANSSVGRYVLQLCKAWNIGCVGVVRDRPTIEDMKAHLTQLGTPGRTKILTYEELADRSNIKLLDIVLGLNCVSGHSETVDMMKVMSNGSRLITYGGMSMKPLVVPTSLLLFRDLKLEGYMLTNWLMKATMDERKTMLNELVKLIDQGKIVDQGNSTIVHLGEGEIANVVREKVKDSMGGLSGKKYLFKFI